MKPMMSQRGCLLLSHSHHVPGANRRQHEFQILGKWFCARCYGIAFGATAALLLLAMYLSGGLQGTKTVLVGLGGPILIGIASYLAFSVPDSGPISRFLSGLLMAIGGWCVLIGVDVTFQSWLADYLVLLAVFVIWNATGLFLGIEASRGQTHRCLMPGRGTDK